MNINEDIQWIQNELEKVKDHDLIETFKRLLTTSSHIEAEKASIDRGLRDIEEGRVYSNESVRKLYEKYL